MTNLPFKGIIPPLVTPLESEESLDESGLARLIEHVIAGNVHGLFLLGTSGEGPSLSHALQRRVVEFACRQIEGRVPVLVGVSDTSPAESLELSRCAADCGADAVVLAAPYYFPMHQQDLIQYVTDFAQRCPLPVVLYNMPSHCKVNYDVETVERLIEIDNIVGMKDSSGDMLYFGQLLERIRGRPDFSLLIGPEELMAEAVLMGGHGGVSGGANIVPEMYVALYEAALTGDLRQVHVLQQRVMRLSQKLYAVGTAPTGYLTGVKCALSLLGLCQGHLAPPLYEMSQEQQQIIAQHLEDLGLATVSEPM